MCPTYVLTRRAHRTRHPTSLVMLKTSLCNVSTVSVSPKRNNWMSTKSYLKRPPSATIARSEKNRNCSSFMSFPRDLVFSCHMALGYTTPSLSSSVPSIGNVATRKSSPRTCITLSFGKPADIGKTTRRTCLRSRLRKTSTDLSL